jgi:vancomycin resistance protein VanW
MSGANIRAILRDTVPFPVRQHCRAFLRLAIDRWHNIPARLGRKGLSLDKSALVLICEVRQPIRRTAHWEGKLNNLKLGAQLIEGISLRPGQLFSFWHFVGNPSGQRGFATGRSIQSGRVQSDTGGGLCQLSGVCYELALRAGLHVLERFQHSFDL